MSKNKDCSQYLRMLRRFRVVEGDMTIRRMQVLLAVYRAGPQGIDLQPLGKQLDIAGGNLTKLTQSWSSRKRDGVKGPGYMTIEPHEDDLSSKKVTITAKGRAASELLLEDSK